MNLPFKNGPPKEGHVNFRGGIPLQMKETEPLAGANRGNGVHHQQISLCGQIEGDHRFQKKKNVTISWMEYLWSFSSARSEA